MDRQIIVESFANDLVTVQRFSPNATFSHSTNQVVGPTSDSKMSLVNVQLPFGASNARVIAEMNRVASTNVRSTMLDIAVNDATSIAAYFAVCIAIHWCNNYLD